MNSRFVAGVAGAASIACASCLFGDLDYTGKPCPCPSGWTCGGPDCSCVPDDESQCAVCARNFRAGWRTPNAVRWDWEPDPGANPQELAEYRLIVGPSEAAVEAVDASTMTFTQAENPELAAFNLRRTGEDGDPVRYTVTDGFEPAQTPNGRLVAVDTAGCEWMSPVVQAASSLVPVGRVDLFDNDGLVDGASSFPPDFVVEPECGSDGTDPCLSCSGDACRSDTENLKINRHFTAGELRTEMVVGTGALDEGTFGEAFLEMKVEMDATEPAYWSEFWVRTHDGSEDGRIFRVAPMTIVNNGVYRTYQIPLRALSEGETALSAGLLLEEADGFDQVNVGGPWTGSEFVHVDDVAIRW